MKRTRDSRRSSQEDHDSFWEIFLSPLLQKHKPEEYDPDFKKSLKPQQLLKLERKLYAQNTCLSGIILEKLRQQDEKTEIVKKQKTRRLDSELADFFSPSQVNSEARDGMSQRQEYSSATTEDVSSISQGASAVIYLDSEEGEEEKQLDENQEASIEKVTGLARDREKVYKKKSHQKVCVSSWCLKDLKLYIKQDRVQLVETLDSRDTASSSQKFGDNRFSSLQSILVTHSRQVLDDQHFSLDQEKGLRLWSFQFTEPMLKEQVVSFMALEIIGSACEVCDVRMKPEQTLEKDNDFPNARVDFALVHKGVVFGVVEVKTPKTMDRKAFVQLLLPLLKLQNQHYEERMQYLGILTDGFRFVFVRLQGDKFTLENAGSEQKPEINIRTVVSWGNLSQLCQYMRSVLNGVTSNMREIAINADLDV